jgi:cellulose biosynthesis protein BcsQ
MREMRKALTRRAAKNAAPVMAVIGAGNGQDRSIAALNVALSAARDGARVLMIDADHQTYSLSNKANGLGREAPNRLGWLNIGAKTSRAIKTANGISILPAINVAAAGDPDIKASDAIHKAIAQAHAEGSCDLVILDGPAMPWSAADHKLFDAADGLVAILPIELDINDSMEDIITALGETERKLIGVVINELDPSTVDRERGKQYA